MTTSGTSGPELPAPTASTPEFATSGPAASIHPGYSDFGLPPGMAPGPDHDASGLGAHDPAQPVLMRPVASPGYRPGRPGPPVWLGILVMLAGPVFALAMMGRAAVSHLDLDRTGVYANHNSAALREGSTYMIGTEAGQPGKHGCKVRLRNGDPVKVAQSDPATVQWTTGAYVVRTSFYLDEPGLYRIDCPQAGPSVLVVPLKGSLVSFGWDMGKWLLVGAALFVTGIVLIVLRRRKPKN